MNALMNVSYAMLVAVMGFAVYVFFANSDYDQKVETAYGIKVVDTEIHVLSSNRLIIE